MPRKRVVDIENAATFRPGGVIVSTRLDTNLAARLFRLAEAKKQPVSTLLRDAIRSYVDPGAEQDAQREYVLNFPSELHTLFVALTLNTHQDIKAVRSAIGVAEPKLSRPIATSDFWLKDELQGAKTTVAS